MRCMALFLMLAACGSTPTEPYVIDATDEEALAECYRPAMIVAPMGPGAGREGRNCTTSCGKREETKLIACGDMCVSTTSGCDLQMSEQDKGLACAHDTVVSARLAGILVPDWPQMRCEPPAD